MKDAVKESGQEALDRGKQVAQEAIGAATGTAKDSVEEQGAEMTDSLKASAREIASTGGGSQ